ncbi:hypothetical protein [Hyphomicrobium sp.]|uniref:hypothetical protein n=1 Tax=Hyphomicrobium sp. TaxID=82 RepID=UPI002CF2CAD8|nr:hypothetical protein [Hyphomicrobium sp.]HRQ27863.1 hypothetical protein [Hyphomicrobium sp.]
MKPEFENLPDLAEAFEAVKGQLFGPLDPALVKLKHKEIIQDARERREQDLDPRGRLGFARDDHTERDRKERLETLLLAIASQRLAEKLRETSEALDGIRDKAQELLERIELLLKEARRDYQTLIENSARHPVTGESIFRYKDGRIETEDGRAVPPDEVQDVDFDGKTTGEEKDAGQSRILELEHYEEEVTGIDRRAESHQERMTDPELDESEREQAIDQAAQDADSMRQRLDDIGSRLGTKLSQGQDLRLESTIDARPSSSTSINIPSL